MIVMPRLTLGWHSWLMDIPPADIHSIERRLHFQANLLKSLLAASLLFAELPALSGLKPSQWVRRLEDLPLTAVYAVFLAAPAGNTHQALHDYLETWRHVKPRITGHDLKKLGIAAGPRYREILQALKDAWLDGEITSEEEEKERLEQLI
jgi:tRNA nucleotidyltransferase (CCA-adding enzyme)